jgi:hypothetical protein
VHWERSARQAYTDLRKAIKAARSFAYQAPTGTGGAAGHALVVMRGVLPVLPELTQPPFDKAWRSGRSGFVEANEELLCRVLERSIANTELAILSLLMGNCPRGSYKILLDGKHHGMSVAEVIEEETELVARAKKRNHQ